MHIQRFTFNPFQENTYLLHAHGEGILIDPGCCDESEQRELEDWLEGQDVRPMRLLLTHAHVDHVMGCAWAERRYGLRPEVHHMDLPLLENTAIASAMFGVGCEPPPAPAAFLEAGQRIPFGQAHLEVLFVPGHAPGHVAFFHPEQRFVIGGDVLFKGGIGRTDLPGGHTQTLLDSIRTVLLPLGDDVVVHPGHGPETTIGAERRGNPFVRAAS